jgi:GTP-binding protein EngB required for normal cell division
MSDASPVAAILPSTPGAPSTPTKNRTTSPENLGNIFFDVFESSPCSSVDSGVEDVFGSPKLDKTSPLCETKPTEESRKLLENNPFDHEKSRVLFNAVDKLRDWRAQDHVAIPQLVIVGGQSSGKSSLLKGLTDIPFPISGKCCTRFPTRIVSNRTAPGTENSYKITIEMPDFPVSGLAQLSEEDCSFTRQGVELTEEIFSGVLEDASQNLMQINQGQGVDKRNFVANVLKVELFGPDLTPLSILDLPGIISAANTVKEEEKEGIKQLVVEYMKQPQNIIICVVSAHTDIDHQEILQLALRHAEPQRLVGVLTKCDKVDEPEMKRHWADFAMNRSEDGGLTISSPWFVVRNRHSMDNSSFDIAVAEGGIFGTAPWSSIPTNRRGTAVLRTHIAGILVSKLRSHFPHIREEIAGLLAGKKSEQASLGQPRNSHASRQKFVVDHVDKMAAVVHDALHNPALVSELELKLRKNIDTLNRIFGASMRQFGHKWNFDNYGLFERSLPIDADLLSRLPDGLRSMANFEKKIEKGSTSEQFIEEINHQFSDLQTTQLPGTINTAIYPIMYSKQTGKWNRVASAYLECVSEAIAVLLQGVFQLHCPAEGSTRILSNELTALYLGLFSETSKEAMRDIESYCKKQTNPQKMLLSSNPVFLEKIEERRFERFMSTQMDRLEKIICISNYAHNGFEKDDNLGKEMLGRELHSVIRREKKDNLALDVHDSIQVYYELNLEHFISKIQDEVVENYLYHEKGPLMCLNSNFIRSLPDETIERLAREDEETMAVRRQLDFDVHHLNNALSILDDALQRTR